MKVCLDTSVLLAALLEQHQSHQAAAAILQTICDGTHEGFVTTHAVAELYATLSAMPLKPRLQPAQVQRLLEQRVWQDFTLIALTAQDYRAAVKLTVDQNLASGAVYDALHIVGARSAQCERLYTFNLRHFRALAPDDSRISSP